MYEGFANIFYFVGLSYTIFIIINAIPGMKSSVTINDVSVPALFFLAAAVSKYLG